jgi:hypothetical protein
MNSLGAPFMILDSSAFANAVTLRLSRFLGYVDPDPPDPVRRVAIEYCLPDTGRPVALLDQELVLPPPDQGWAVTLGGGGLFGPDALWELWDNAASHVKTFPEEELPMVFTKEAGHLRLALAVDPEAGRMVELATAERLLRPLRPEDRELVHR